MNRRTISATVALLGCALAAPRPSAAQSVPATPAGPTMAAASTAFRPPASPFAPAPVNYAARLTRDQQLMIIGGAIFLVGAIIGDDAGTVIMVGGAGVGLYGLYLYLERQD
ncbi:MAG TPA: hypothetical protein VJ803_10430 [Gemmatimonadaceae bacterium]|nr:hypothetical protein [Gemmatimonadaceae bacterium]